MKNIQGSDIDDVLVKYLLGETTEKETRVVTDWIAEDAANRKHFDQFELIWKESKKLEGKTTIQTEDAWARFRQRVDREEIVERKKTPIIPFNTFSIFKVAAMLVMMVGAGWMIYTMAGTDNGQLLASSFDKVVIKTLPDGSVVTLNKNSELSYPAHFEGASRTVSLKGEAFFNITPNKEQPFIIDAGNSSVTVVGTSFNVKSRLGATEVIVETGIVKVEQNKQSVQLLPGQKVTLRKGSDKPVLENTPDELYNYYRTNKFVCKQIPLSKVVTTLSEAYNVPIRLEGEQLKSLLLTATYKKDSLNTIINVISKTFGLQVVQTGNEIILKER